MCFGGYILYVILISQVRFVRKTFSFCSVGEFSEINVSVSTLCLTGKRLELEIRTLELDMYGQSGS